MKIPTCIIVASAAGVAFAVYVRYMNARASLPSEEPNSTSASSDRKISFQELRANDGKTSNSIWVSLRRRVFDVSTGRSFYGEGSSYALLAGHDGSFVLGMMKLEKELLDRLDFETLSEDNNKTLSDWIAKFEKKYPVVGVLDA